MIPTGAYYNEFDPGASAWLRNLIKAGLIAPGEVDERSIEDVVPADLRGFTQVHMFAGIAGWSLALRRAGWPDDRPVWSGSCPCQPFSAIGARAGLADERHLWPAWFRLIQELRPGAVFGEQVASKDSEPWLEHVQTDLEGADYAFAAFDLPACGFGAPHLRQRLYFLGHTDRPGPQGHARHGGAARWQGAAGPAAAPGVLAGQQPGPVNGFWADADWLVDRDGRWKSVQPGTFPLAPRHPARVELLRGYGNGLCVPTAQAFIEASIETLKETL